MARDLVICARELTIREFMQKSEKLKELCHEIEPIERNIKITAQYRDKRVK